MISLMTCDLGAVFELIGATSACVLAYILPPLCYIKLSTRSWRTVPAVLCICFGVAVLVVSVVLALAKMVTSKSSHVYDVFNGENADHIADEGQPHQC